MQSTAGKKDAEERTTNQKANVEWLPKEQKRRRVGGVFEMQESQSWSEERRLDRVLSHCFAGVKAGAPPAHRSAQGLATNRCCQTEWWRRPRCPAAIRNSLGRVSRSSGDGIPFQLGQFVFQRGAPRPALVFFVFTARLKIIATRLGSDVTSHRAVILCIKLESGLCAHLVRFVVSAASVVEPAG
jgi:hypothetical protein